MISEPKTGAERSRFGSQPWYHWHRKFGLELSRRRRKNRDVCTLTKISPQ
jgi:hypothetical protein